MQRLVIWGAGGQGREVWQLCQDLGVQVLGFLDERPSEKGTTVKGLPVIGNLVDLIDHLRRSRIDLNTVGIVCAGVGDPRLKKRFFQEVKASDFQVAQALVHPSSSLGAGSEIGEGSVVFKGTYISVDVEIGSCVALNAHCSLSHDCKVGDFATLSPGTNVAGWAQIEEGAMLGINSAVRDRMTVGAWAVVAGGAFVARSVPPQSMVAGVPAVVKKSYSDP